MAVAEGLVFRVFAGIVIVRYILNSPLFSGERRPGTDD
jgi:hypothetical protein